ncbi:hypothetical protein LCGC14_1596490 [marine sediment metagenome]|uniref:Uncharacterized protein n=1 Tax=marine sediment metagenome TaxID=412755 RepID=A0A0F9ICT3_9ZZZZ
MRKKGQILQLQNLIVPLIGIGIVLVVGFLIMAESKDVVFEQTLTTDWCNPYDNIRGNYEISKVFGDVECCNTTWCNDGTNYMYNVSANLCCNVSDAGGFVNCTSTGGSAMTQAVATGTNCTDGHTQSARTSLAWNGTGTTQEAISTIPGWLPIIVITIIGAIVIGLVSLFRRQQ